MLKSSKNIACRLRKKYVKLCPWHYMATSFHKLLIHGAEIIGHALLPIGQLSEDAQESWNKDIQLFRQDFPIKCLRQTNKTDALLHQTHSFPAFRKYLRGDK